MKKILFLSLFSCFSIVMYAQQDAHNPAVAPSDASSKAAVVAKPAEEALVLKETEHDFGKIPQGKPVTTVFSVTNSGKTALKIDNVQASCGCTTPEWEKDKAIEPGATSKITVGYNAAAEGPFTKTITITYNGTQTRQLAIKGEVWKTPAASAPANAAANDLKN
jgi:hypothetical protein